MSRFRQAVLWAALIAILLLAALSVYGAFLGADRARAFFNSLPLAVYWFGLAGLLIAGMVMFRRLLLIPSLLLMHLGCILVLAGGMWGSQAGHAIQKQLLGIDKIPESRMAISEQTEDNRVWIGDSNDTRELPFSVRLHDFRVEYYEPGTLVIRGDGQMWKLRAEPDARIALNDSLGSVTVQKTFRNFKLRVEDGKHVPYDAPGDSNPALQVQIERPDGTTTHGYVFENFQPIFPSPIDVDMRYQRTIRDYISELEVTENGEVVAAKDIEVNHPLHYGGYHLYQHSYGEDHSYTVLQVVSDSGLNAVYGGYVMLVAGIVWHFWGRRMLIAIKSRRQTASIEVGSQHE